MKLRTFLKSAIASLAALIPGSARAKDVGSKPYPNLSYDPLSKHPHDTDYKRAARRVAAIGLSGDGFLTLHGELRGRGHVEFDRMWRMITNRPLFGPLVGGADEPWTIAVYHDSRELRVESKGKAAWTVRYRFCYGCIDEGARSPAKEVWMAPDDVDPDVCARGADWIGGTLTLVG